MPEPCWRKLALGKTLGKFLNKAKNNFRKENIFF
jgi:hypothetical protein